MVINACCVSIAWTGAVEFQWKKAVIVSMLKKDKPESKIGSFYRISLTSVVVKVRERMIADN